MALKLTPRLVFVNVLVLFVLIVVMEVISRIVLYEVYNRSFDHRLLVDNKYGNSTGMKANSEAVIWGRQLHTDALGWRKNKAPLTGKKKKWLFIGDSVAEGVGVDDSSTFVSLCSDELRDYDVVNCSLIGYSTADYLNVLQDYFVKQDTSIEIVTVCYCLNDVYGASKSTELPAIAKQNWIGKFNGWLQDNYATYRLIKLLVFKKSNRYYQYDAAFYTARNPNFTSSMQLLKQCDSLCKERNIFLNVVLLPYRSQATGLDNEEPQALVDSFCKANAIEVSNANEYLKKIEKPSNLYLFADEIHFSVEGHKRVAEYLTR